jgi:hypothetical protein
MAIDIGQVAYEGYKASTGATVDEDGWPSWDHLPPEAREHWRAAADAVTMWLDLAEARDHPGRTITR